MIQKVFLLYFILKNNTHAFACFFVTALCISTVTVFESDSTDHGNGLNGDW